MVRVPTRKSVGAIGVCRRRSRFALGAGTDYGPPEQTRVLSASREIDPYARGNLGWDSRLALRNGARRGRQWMVVGKAWGQFMSRVVMS